LSGDLPSNIEEYLVTTEEERLHANVLKLGHHGSRTSSSLSWLTAVHPDIAVASLGLNNRYGHPHKEVLERLDSLHIPLLRTDQEGTIIFTSDGKSVVRVK
jgi:competence protein ComEC